MRHLNLKASLMLAIVIATLPGSITNAAAAKPTLPATVVFKIWNPATKAFTPTPDPGYLFNPEDEMVRADITLTGTPGAAISTSCTDVFVKMITDSPDNGVFRAKRCPDAYIGTFSKSGRLTLKVELALAVGFCNAKNTITLNTPAGQKDFDLAVDCGE